MNIPRIRTNNLRYIGCDKGVALVLVLWIIVLLSVIGISHSHNVRLDMQMARHHVESARARALAESGVNRAIYELFNNNDEERWLFNGQLYYMTYPEGELQIKIRNTAGLVDINTAAPEVLKTLLSGVDMEESERSALVDAILDWKDSDDFIRPNGAEDTEYKMQDYDYGTPDRQFFSIGELRYVLGMNTALYNTLSPYITVFSGQTDVNFDYAPEELSILFSGASDTLDTIIDSDIDDQTTLENVEEEQSAANIPQGRESKVFHISVWATLMTGAAAGLEVDVDITQRKGKPYTILSWQESSQ